MRNPRVGLHPPWFGFVLLVLVFAFAIGVEIAIAKGWL